MDDLERPFRDALHRADTVAVPVPPIDPTEFSGRSRRRSAWPRALAAAAVVVFVAGVSIAVWTGAGRGIPAVPVAPNTSPAVLPTTVPAGVPSVEVDVFSGRGNPVVELEASIADELYAMVGDQEAAGELEDEAPPEGDLGFRGLVVHPADDERPTLRILPGAVYVGSDGDTKLLRDPSTRFFDVVTAALTPELRDLVAAGSVQLRVSNAGKTRLTDVEARLPNGQVIAAGLLGAGRASGYQIVGQAYTYAWIVATEDGQEHELRPTDYVGETPLAPGRYTYQLSVHGGQLEVELVHDPDGGWPEQPDAPVGEPSDGPQGDPATWVLVHPDQVGPDSTEITIGVTRLDCNGGVTGEALEPVVEYTESELVIRALVAPIDTDLPRTCPGNDQVPVVVTLTEPIGDRDLVDAACLSGEAVSTSFCAAGPVRWTP